VAGSIVFYESLLPHLVGEDQLDRVSSAGYAIGYLGGGMLLAINLLMIQEPELFGIPDAGTGTRLALASVAVWWVVFSIPLFRRVPEPAVRRELDERSGAGALSGGVTRLMETFRELRRYRDAFVFLLAFLLYNDGIQTMIRMATIYGTGIGLPERAMITALLLTQFIGVPCAFLFGMAASRTGARTGVFVGLGVYILITLLGYFMRTAAHFYALAVLVGMVQGGTQALSRSLFASMIPRHKSSEFFAFFSVFERYAGVLGPAIFAFVIERSGSGRAAILAVAVFFVVGAAILAFVNVERGRAAARAAEADLRPVS
jgi:UMF1 family MFS transporter